MRLAVERPDKGAAINAFRIEPCPAVTEPRAAKATRKNYRFKEAVSAIWYSSTPDGMGRL